MRRLILLRHAKSDWSEPAKRDHDRPLNPRGRAAAPRIGRYMAENGLLPDRVAVSPSLRTRQTFALVAQAFARAPAENLDPRIYEAAPDTLLALIREAPEAARTLLVVGHNPGLHELALALVRPGDSDAHAHLHDKMPTGALAVIDFPSGNWRGIRPGTGRLDRFVTPRSLAEPAA